MRMFWACGMFPEMNSVARILAVLSLVVLGCSCRRNDFRVHKIHVPGLKNERCVEVVSNVLVQFSQQPSMDSSIKVAGMRFDLKGRSVIVEYDSMKVAQKNLEHAIAAVGFDANDIPADSNAVARLPLECR